MFVKPNKFPMLEQLNILEALLDVMPFVFWRGINGKCQGANYNQAINFGFKSPQEFIGKTIFEVLDDQEAAKIIYENDNMVMRENRTLIVEERIGEKIYYSQKSPMHDNKGNVIGLIGFSMDITELKKKEEELKKERDVLVNTALQAVHDIRSPLASLLMIVKFCEKHIPEQARVILSETATSIDDIANNLLSKYNQNDVHVNNATEERQPVLVSLLLSQLLTEKKYQYSNLPIKIEAKFNQSGNFVFIKVEPTAFKRMISNLINNSVDAFEGGEGNVVLKLIVDKAQTKIVIEDNGKGMSQQIIDKITNGEVITANKENGHGIGLIQVHDTLRRNQGQISIISKVDKGTKITLTFPRVSSPEWFAEKIQLKKGDTVVILDDDESISGAWEARLKEYATDIYLEHFTQAIEAINFINAAPLKEKIFLLADFELLKQDLNGLHVIERTDIKRSILVTSHYANQTVRDLAAKLGAKILPKQLAPEVPITLE